MTKEEFRELKPYMVVRICSEREVLERGWEYGLTGTLIHDRDMPIIMPMQSHLGRLMQVIEMHENPTGDCWCVLANDRGEIVCGCWTPRVIAYVVDKNDLENEPILIQ